MALPHKVAKVTLSGTMFSGQEVWSTGFYLGWEDKDHDPISDQAPADVAGAFSTFFTTTTSQIQSNYSFQTCKIVSIATDGKTIPDTAKYYSLPTAVNGGYGGPAFPPQIALVCTLSNSLPRGLATKGRMFLPGVTVSPDATGHIAANVVTNIATNMKTFFDAVYNDADLPGNPVLASTGNALQLRPGAIRKVSQIRVGNVFDTQRRRRNALAEMYTIKPVAGG